MHIVLANQWYPPESGWGGVARYNHAVAHAYRKLGHSITVIASRTSPNIPATRTDGGIDVRRLLVSDAYRWRRVPFLGRYVRPLQQLTYSRRLDGALRELHREHPIDIIEFAEVNAEGFFYARHPFAPFVIRCHTPTFVLKKYYTPHEMPYDTRIISWCEQDVIRRAPVLTAPSKDMASVISRECGLPLQSITVIPNALESSEFQLPGINDRLSNHLTILHVGRLDRVKGITTLAQAIPLVLRQVANARFVFVGDDRTTGNGTSQRADLEMQFAQAGVTDQVQFTGGVDHATLIDWYRRADICVVPSMLYESFSYTCAQAMAAGKPIVGTRIGGVPETVDDEVCGLIVEPGNVEQLADAIIRLAQNVTSREQFGYAGHSKVTQEFDPMKIAQQNFLVYERAKQTFKNTLGRF